MDRYEWCGVEPGSEVKNMSGRGRKIDTLKRYKMYYNEAVGKIEMYLLCQKYHMSGCVQYEQNSEMMVELYGEERKIIDFMPILEKSFNRKPCKVIEMTGEPDYGVGDFRIWIIYNKDIGNFAKLREYLEQ